MGLVGLGFGVGSGVHLGDIDLDRLLIMRYIHTHGATVKIDESRWAGDALTILRLASYAGGQHSPKGR